MDFLKNNIEALIFCSSEPITPKELQSCLSEMLETTVPISDVEFALAQLEEKYKMGDFAFQIEKIAEGYQFFSKSEYQTSISILLKHKSKKRLSRAALETLSIIAYKQPVTKNEMEQIRGVNCDYSLQKLLEKELIDLKGKADTPGRPILYGTSDKFLEYFGINSVADLPLPRDFSQEEGEKKEMKEDNTPQV